MRRITILTDFGTADGYVAAMRGVLASLAPYATVEDVSHYIPAGDIRHAAWTLRRYWRLYPEGTIHLVVVDPGVGTGRRALAARIDGRYFVGPDNGVLTWVLEEAGIEAAVTLDRSRYRRAVVAPTFHGRDIFSPAAGHLAAGIALEELGSTLIHPVRFPVPTARRLEDGTAEGEVVHVDRFGNLITDIPGAWARHAAGADAGGAGGGDPDAEDAEAGGTTRVSIGGTLVGPVRSTYGEVEPGEALALIGSDGTVEIAVRDGSAAERLGAGVGAPVLVGRD